MTVGQSAKHSGGGVAARSLLSIVQHLHFSNPHSHLSNHRTQVDPKQEFSYTILSADTMATFELSNFILGVKRVFAATLELIPSTTLAVRAPTHTKVSVAK